MKFLVGDDVDEVDSFHVLAVPGEPMAVSLGCDILPTSELSRQPGQAMKWQVLVLSCEPMRCRTKPDATTLSSAAFRPVGKNSQMEEGIGNLTRFPLCGTLSPVRRVVNRGRSHTGMLEVTLLRGLFEP